MTSSWMQFLIFWQSITASHLRASIFLNRIPDHHKAKFAQDLQGKQIYVIAVMGHRPGCSEAGSREIRSVSGRGSIFFLTQKRPTDGARLCRGSDFGNNVVVVSEGGSGG